MKVGFISLGCSKNLIDTEMMIGLFKNNAYTIENDPKEAEIIIINTCGFIESAKEEAINTILEMAEYKKTGKCQYLIATGCLVQRYQKELSKAIPEVDLWIKIEEYEEMWEKVETLISSKKRNSEQLAYLNRVVTTGTTTAYLKIAEGCSNRCTYCAIPKIRGPYQSRKKEDILKEADMLAKRGIKELIIIAQDTTKYGIDVYEEFKLAELLHEISKIEGIKWIRFLYAYPESITSELIQEVKQNEKICSYFDIPIQHIADSVLKRMNRRTTRKDIEKLIQTIRKEIPEVIIRTTVMVGFPGETEKDFKELYEFIKKVRIDKMGAFSYSKEEGTPAALLQEQIHGNTKKKRLNQIMQLQKEISLKNMQNKIGKNYETLIEDVTLDNKYYIGRTYMDVPEMDGVVYIEKKGTNLLGRFIKVEITKVREYDMIGIIKE